jgi:hypothetical protein
MSVPVIVIGVPTGPLVGAIAVSVGVGVGGGAVTVKGRPLLAAPPTVTTTVPLVAPAGTGTPMLVADQFAGDARVPLKVTVLAPCVTPKFVPAIVTTVPIAPDEGDTLKRVGVGEPGTSNGTSTE